MKLEEMSGNRKRDIIDQLREELEREPTSREIEISMKSINRGMG